MAPSPWPGFEVAAIRMRRGDELELVVDTGLPEEVGSRIPVQLMLDELAVAEDWGLLRFVPHERGSTAPRGRLGRSPTSWSSDDPDAWHPMDMLVAPLYDGQGELRGTFAIDCPLNGRRPDPESRRVLERFARTGRARRDVRGRAGVAGRAGRDGRHRQVHRAHLERPAQPRRPAASERAARCSRASTPSTCGSRPWPTTTSSGAEYLARRARATRCRPTIVAFAEKAAQLLLAPAGRDDGRRPTTRCRPRWRPSTSDHDRGPAARHRACPRWSSSRSAPARSAWAAWC